MTALTLPGPVQRRLDASARALLTPDGGKGIDFSRPAGEPALVPADSVSWRIFKNPVSLFIGGVAAVILELAEPRVRAGVWDHSSFRVDPVRRLQRTGLAAMVTVYGGRSQAEAMIAGVNRRHARVSGLADDGSPYVASDVDLLDWVQATASYGFISAYDRFVAPLDDRDRDRAWAEAGPAARLYGAIGAPASEAEWRAMLAEVSPRLTPSPVIAEFLAIMGRAPAFPTPLRPLQHLLIRAAVDLVPGDLQDRLGIRSKGLSAWHRPFLSVAAKVSDRLVLSEAPPAQSCLRVGLPVDWLYRS